MSDLAQGHSSPTMGERLRTARQAKGWSTRLVAERVRPAATLSHATIANYEKDATRPPADVLSMLATIYERPLNWFLGGGPMLAGVRYRNAKTKVGMRDRHRFEGMAQRWLEAYIAIEAHLDQPLSALADPTLSKTGFTIDAPDRAANSLRMSLNLDNYDPLPSVIEVLENLGVRVLGVETDLAIDGLAARLGDEHVIVLNSNVSNDRARLNAAHELAHVLSGDCESAQDDRDIEKAAFNFASHLLLTPRMLEAAFAGKSMVRLLQFKERFGISLAAMIYRAEQERIVSGDLAKRLWIEFSRRGWRRKEPGVVRADRPIRFETLLDSAMVEQDLSLKALSDVAGVRVEELRRRLDLAMGFGETGGNDDPPTDYHRLRLVR